MDDLKSLHTKRLNEYFEHIPRIKGDRKVNAWEPRFKVWKDNVKHSLVELFGEKHGYTRRFIRLKFWEMRASLMEEVVLDQDDQKRFSDDLNTAELLLGDALEELNIDITPAETQPEPTEQQPPQFVINVNNVLTQTTTVNVEQVIENIDRLDLPDEEKALAKLHAKELSEEANGQQRWPVLAKWIQKIRDLGQSAYKEIAVPLIIEMLKKQMGG
jgi:hypothetical protein